MDWSEARDSGPGLLTTHVGHVTVQFFVSLPCQASKISSEEPTGPFPCQCDPRHDDTPSIQPENESLEGQAARKTSLYLVHAPASNV